MTDTDDVIFARLCAAGSEFMARGLQQARGASAQLYGDAEQLVAEGRAEIELAVRFRPTVSVAVRLIDGQGALIATLARYETTGEPPAAVN